MTQFDTRRFQQLIDASPSLRRALDRQIVAAVKKVAPINQSDARLQILPFEEPERGGLFTDTAQTSLRFVARPQVRFRGERLIAVVSRNAQAATNGVSFEATSFTVGADPQTVSAGGGSLPLEAWDPQAVGVRLQLDDAEPGIEIAARVEPILPLVQGDQAVVRLMLLGTAID